MGSGFILPTPGQPKEGPDPSFISATTPNLVSFQLNNIAPPSPLYIQRDDVLRLDCWNSLAGVTVNINGRLLLPPQLSPGQPDVLAKAGVPSTIIGPAVVVPFSVSFIPASNKSRSTFNLPLGEGFLLSTQLFAQVGAPLRGQTFCQLEVLRGGTASAVGMWTLLADYLTNGASLSWPGGRIQQSVEGPGFLHSQAVSNPAAGADWTFTIPVNTRMRIISAAMQLAAANAGTARVVQSNSDDGVNTYHLGSPNQTVAINTTVRVTFSTTIPTAVATVTDVMSALPSGLWQPAGHRLSSRTANINAADQYSLINLMVEEWIET